MIGARSNRTRVAQLSATRARAPSSARALVAALACAVLPNVGCAPPHSRGPTNVIDLRYRMRPASSSTIDLYRWTGSRAGSVKSRCKMVPTDSEMFAARAERCGGLRAWFWGVARVLVEQANSPRFTPPLRVDGRLRWVDLPPDRCGD